MSHFKIKCVLNFYLVTSSPKKTKLMPAVGYKALTGLFSSMTVTGRIVLDLWRLMSHEVNMSMLFRNSV